MIPLHLGSLHPYEQALTFGLAFGPFLVLAVVIAVRRRADAAREAAAEHEEHHVPEGPAAERAHSADSPGPDAS
ncbi:hypothetical protein JK386_16475 [Nocardioides sp. zg-536]|uniref:Uncharacterized protein n=1 Tax=Nocardioides faecalis TaxID=2803858 RepID=A0A939BWW9_9ACTN|nr:hypothetical protein [Nocardioides faecalis]MBM9461501.1 hypothetical protein [Nocardioides faecalis]QVI57868.1 hypothetical protein KG111_12490 [Nocardioides faecalis]